MARFGAKRPKETRETLPIIVIVCDDSRTVPTYFAEVRSLFKEYCTLKPIPVPKDPEAVIAFACTQQSELSDGGKGATVWALIDLEMRANSEALNTSLLEQAKKCDINLVLSQPCFEVWVLAHFMNTGALYQSCDAVLQEVRKQWRTAFGQDFPQKKAQADYRKLLDRISAAISNSRAHAAPHSQSWTDVWKVLEHIRKFQPS